MNLVYRLQKYLPFLRWGRNMTRTTVRADAIAGLTGAAIVLPQGVAFAAIAGMPPEYGLYTSMVPAVIAALFGSSWHLVSGPTTAASIIMFASLSGMAAPGSEEYVSLAITLAFMVGGLQLIMGIVRLGALVNFISHSVVVGFTAGAACLIAAKQGKDFLGIEIPEGGHLFNTLEFLWQNWEQLHPLVMLVGAVTFALPEQTRERLILPLVAFSAGSLLGGALLHMIPEAVSRSEGQLTVFLWVLAGFTTFFALEQFLHWHHWHPHEAGGDADTQLQREVGTRL